MPLDRLFTTMQGYFGAVYVNDINGLTVLTGELAATGPIPAESPHLLIGIPAETLRQRLDLQAFERRLAAQHVRQRAARADLSPRLRLTGSLGLESFSSGSFISSDSFGFSLDPLSLTLPIFNGGALRRNVRLQDAKERELSAQNGLKYRDKFIDDAAANPKWTWRRRF